MDHVSELLLLAMLLSPPLDFEWVSLASSLLLRPPKFTPPLPRKAKRLKRAPQQYRFWMKKETDVQFLPLNTRTLAQFSPAQALVACP